MTVDLTAYDGEKAWEDLMRKRADLKFMRNVWFRRSKTHKSRAEARAALKAWTSARSFVDVLEYDESRLDVLVQLARLKGQTSLREAHEKTLEQTQRNLEEWKPKLAPAFGAVVKALGAIE